MRAKVSPATISRIIRNESEFAASYTTERKILAALGIEISYKRAKSSSVGSNIIFDQFQFTPHASEVESRNVFLNALKKSQGRAAVYACDTIPEFLKTTSVLTAELGKKFDAEAYSGYMSSIVSEMSDLGNFSGVIFIDDAIFSSLLNRTGLYQQLSQDDVDEQVSAIKLFFEAVFPKVQGYVLDFRKNGLTTVFILDNGYGVNFFYRGYLEWSCEELNQKIFRQSVDALSSSSQILQLLTP